MKLKYTAKKLIVVFTLTFGIFFSTGLWGNVTASTMDHRFYIKLPDGTREEIKGVIIHQVATGSESGEDYNSPEPIPWSEPRVTFSQFDFCIYEGTTGGDSWAVTDDDFACGTLASCHAEMFAAPYLPEGFNDNRNANTMIDQIWEAPPRVLDHSIEYQVAMDATFKTFDGNQTFTEKYPWFKFESGNPRGSDTAYWAGEVVNACTGISGCENNPIQFVQYGNLPDNPVFGSALDQIDGFMLSWERLPDYPEYSREPGDGTKYARWYGPSDKPSWAGNDIAEVVLDPIGGNVYKGSVEWTLIETEFDDQPECGDGICNLDDETCDGDAKCEGGGILSSGECRAPGTADECTYCGDGEVQSGEDCDDGNSDDNDECSNDCRSQFLQTTSQGTTQNTTALTTTPQTSTQGTTTGDVTTQETTQLTTQLTTGLSTGLSTQLSTTAELPPTGIFSDGQSGRVLAGIILLSIGMTVYIFSVGDKLSRYIARRFG